MIEPIPLSRLSEDELLDTLYKALANRKRRRMLRYLADHPEPIPTTQLATEMSALEYGSESSAVPTEQQSDTHVSLSHVHLPMLNEAGMVSWDRDNDTIAIAPALRELVVTTTGDILGVSASVNELL